MKRDYIDFQDRSEPIAFLITIRCYGTWLHGDERGSVDRVEFNKYGLPKIPRNDKLIEYRSSQMSDEPMKFAAKHRKAVKTAIHELCEFRKITLHAINVRTNHAHIVVAAGYGPDKLMGSMKAYATRRLRSDGLVSESTKVWSRHGSTRYLWSEDHIWKACEYVIGGQGGDLPTFD